MQAVTSMRDRVLEYILKALPEQRRQGYWLNGSLPFNHGCIIADDEASRKAIELLALLPIKRERNRNWKQKCNDVNILCANLLRQEFKDNDPPFMHLVCNIGYLHQRCA
jgi:hypothetical protein